MQLVNKQFYANYALDDTSYKYGRLGGPTGLPVPSYRGCVTVGSATTVSAVAAGEAPFFHVNAGDIITFPVPPDTLLQRTVDSKTSNDEIEVSAAVDLSDGCSGWFFLPFQIGTTDQHGWHSVSDLKDLTLLVAIATLNSTGGLDISIETIADLGATLPVTLLTKNYAAAGTDSIVITEAMRWLRVGVKAHTAVVAGDDITISLNGRIWSTR